MLTWQTILLRLALAVAVGFIIGLERERHHRPAGIKTHILVCAGAAVISMIQINIVEDAIAKVGADPNLAQVIKTDYGRLSAQVISGVGFLGAGCILHNKGSISGLTTAATLWFAACVGIGVGMGYYMITVLSTAMVMAVILTFRLIRTLMSNHTNKKQKRLRNKPAEDDYNISDD